MTAQGSSLNLDLVRESDVSLVLILGTFLLKLTLNYCLSCSVCVGSSWESDAASETPPLVQDRGCKEPPRMKKEETELEGTSVKEEVSHSHSLT